MALQSATILISGNNIIFHLRKHLVISLLSLFLILLPIMGCTEQDNSITDGVLKVVAGENFWGSIAAQLGGTHADVSSLISAPNTDPHEYETSAADARMISRANYVIFNGAGYDSWGRKMLDANPVNGRKVLDIATLLGKKQGDNPHFWYHPVYVEQVANQITRDYQELNPADALYFEQQHIAFENALSQYYQLISSLKQNYAGIKIGATESIFVYMADALGLNLTTPPAFMNAVSASSDPPVPSVALFQQQINERQIAVLIYNSQTATLITTNLKQLAENAEIPLLGITETVIPQDTTFQDWQIKQLQDLQNALSSLY